MSVYENNYFRKGRKFYHKKYQIYIDEMTWRQERIGESDTEIFAKKSSFRTWEYFQKE